MTWPVTGNLGTFIPGNEGDAWVHLWTFDWIRSALLQGRSPFFTDLLFFPNGQSLVFHNIAWLHFALWLPLQAVVSAGAAYSLVFLANFVFNAFATYLLADDLFSSYAPSFIAGLVAGFWPYTMSQHSHPNLIAIGWLPLIILTLRKLLVGRTWRDALLLALFIALAGITRWQMLILIAPAAGIYALYALLAERNIFRWRTFGLLAVATILSIIIMLPLAAPLIVGQLTREHPEDLYVEAASTDSTDALAYVIPSRYQRVWGETIYELGYQRFTRNKDFTPFIGYTTLLLALIAVIRSRQSWVWLVIALSYMLLAVGPVLSIYGREIASMPYAFLYDSFALRMIRYPDRLNVVLGVPMGLLAALGLQSILQSKWFSRRWLKVAVTGLVAGLILLEYIAVYPLLPLQVPVWYESHTVDGDAETYAFVDIPMNSRSFDENYMLYQISHRRPMVGGHVSRVPREAFNFIDSIPLLVAVREGERLPPDLSDVSHELDLLHESGVRYLILHQKYLTNSQETEWRRWLGQAPTYEDDDLIVYETGPTEQRRDFALSYVPLAPELPFGIVEARMAPDSAAPGGFVWVDLHWGSSAPSGEDYEVCVQLEEGGNAVSAPRCQVLAPDWPASLWGADEIAYTGFVLPIDPFIETGTYTVVLTLSSAEGTPLGTTGVGEVAIQEAERQFELPRSPAFPVDATWDDTLTLLGYDLEQTREALAVTLTWQALERPDQSYKLFLHLRELTNDTIVVQTDLIPRNWTYPTDWWEAGEYVVDTITLPLTGVAPGRYRLVLGWYDEETQTRLPLSAGAAVGAGELQLTIVEVDASR
jgi:hypothetical protein